MTCDRQHEPFSIPSHITHDLRVPYGFCNHGYEDTQRKAASSALAVSQPCDAVR